MFREIIFIVREQGLRASSNEKFFLENLKRKIYARIHFQRLWITFLDLNLSQTIIEARVVYMQKKMQKNQVILINHPTQPAFSPIPTFPNQRYPKAAFPNSPTCLNLSRSPTHRTTNQKIPKYHNLLDSKPTQTLSLSPSQPTSTSNPTSPTSKKTSSTRGDKRCPRILLSNVFKLTSN